MSNTISGINKLQITPIVEPKMTQGKRTFTIL